MTSPRPAAILFDLDGTLLDTLQDLTDSLNRVLAAEGLPTHPPARVRYLVGEGVRNLVRRAVPESDRAPARIDRLLAAFHADYGQTWAVETSLYPGIAALLDALHAHGLPLTVLSNKPHAVVVEAVVHYLNRWPFTVVAGEREAQGVPRKPDPAGAVAIAEAVGVAPARFLYFGDTATDMETARRAGMIPVGVLWGFREAEELRAAGAAHLIAHPLDILRLVTFPEPSQGL